MRFWALTAAVMIALGVLPGVGEARSGNSVTDLTLSCATGDMGGVNGFLVSADPLTLGTDNGVIPAILSVGTDQGSTSLLFLGTQAKGFTFDGKRCRRVHSRVPLTHRGLPLNVRVKGGEHVDGFSGRCFRGGSILIRLRLRVDAKGVPAAALLAVQLSKTKRTVEFVNWSPQWVSAYLWPKCPV